MVKIKERKWAWAQTNTEGRNNYLYLNPNDYRSWGWNSYWGWKATLFVDKWVPITPDEIILPESPARISAETGYIITFETSGTPVDDTFEEDVIILPESKGWNKEERVAVSDLIKSLQKTLNDVKRYLKFENLDELIGTNLLKHNYLTNASIWLMDTTILGSNFKEVFTMQDLASRRILALCYSKTSGETELMSTFEATLNPDANEKPPLILHGDNCRTYESSAFKEMLNHYGVCLSFTKKVKHGNQPIESAFNAFKNKLCMKVMEKYHIPQSQPKLLEMKTNLKEELKVEFGKRIKKAYSDREEHDMVFNSPFFQHVCNIDLILKIMNEMNQRKHVDYRKYTRNEVHFLLGRLQYVSATELLLVRRSTTLGQNLKESVLSNLNRIKEEKLSLRKQGPLVGVRPYKKEQWNNRELLEQLNWVDLNPKILTINFGNISQNKILKQELDENLKNQNTAIQVQKLSCNRAFIIFNRT